MIRKSIGFLVLSAVFICAHSHALILPVGMKANNITSNFVVNAVDNKVYTVDGSVIRTFDLYADSGALTTGVAMQTITCTYTAMALDVMKKKLYVGGVRGDIQIYSLSDSGLILTPPAYHSHKSGDYKINCIHIDFKNNLLLSAGADTGFANIFSGIVVSRLGSDGLPAQALGDTYNFNLYFQGYPWLMMEDVNLGKIYRGYATIHQASVVSLKPDGYPDTPTGTLVGDYGGSGGSVYDPVSRRVYFVRTNYPVYMWRLDNYGTPTSYDTDFLNQSGYVWYGIAIDAARRKMFLAGYNWGGWYNDMRYYNLDSDGRLGTMIDSGPPSTHLNCMAYEPYYNKIYLARWTGGLEDFRTYNGPDSPMVPLKINDSESLTEIPNITLKLQHSNPNFIYVSGDLLSVGSPVNNLNQWVSCGGDFWKNSGETMMAVTLNVPAVLSSGVGQKTIEVWYSGSTSINFTGMMRKATATITLIESSARVNSIGLSRIDYNGARVDYTVIDGRDRNVNLDVQYRTKDKDWTDMTIISGEGKTDITATISGTAHYLVWDIEKDLPENSQDVQVRIKAENGDSMGAWTESAKYGVPEWTGNDIRAVNVSIKKSDGTWTYRTRVEWSGLSDTTTTYELKKKEDEGDWSFVTTTTGTLYEIENLSDTPVYSFKARLRTKEGLFSAYGNETKIKLARRIYATGTIGAGGGKIRIEDFDGNSSNDAVVEIEEGTFKEDVDVVLEKQGGLEYEITAKNSRGYTLKQTDFRKGVIIRLSYVKEEIANNGWKEDELAIFHFDRVNWVSIGGKIDKTNSVITAKVRHFSRFKIAKNSNRLALVSPGFITPNGDGINDVVNFYLSQQSAVESCEITVYDVDGRVIRIIKADGTNTLFWDGRDSIGNLCETGIYVCVIKSGDNKLTQTIQLAK